MTYQDAIEKAYGLAYIRQAPLEQVIIAADNGKTIIEDEDNIYFFFASNESTGSDAILSLANKYGGVARIDNLFEEDGSFNYRIWISRKAPQEIIQFVCVLICQSEDIYPMIFGVPIHEVAEHIYQCANNHQRKNTPYKIDSISAQNIVDYIKKKCNIATNEQVMTLLVERYTAYSVAPKSNKYWIYRRGIGLECDKLPFPASKVIECSQKQVEEYPQIKWKSEYELYKLVLSYYEDATFHYSTSWLGDQHLDIFVPSISLGIEYQGKQHYESVDFFGGAHEFENRKALDEQKRKIAKENDIILMEWHYIIPITAINFVVLLNGCGIETIPKPNPMRKPNKKNNTEMCENERILYEIRQYTIDGIFLNRYETYKKAEIACNISAKQIQKAVTGYTKTAGGFLWKRCAANDEIMDVIPVSEQVQENQGKKIYQVTHNGEVIAEYSSINEAARATRINRKSISCALNHTQKTAGGYEWIYAEQ